MAEVMQSRLPVGYLWQMALPRNLVVGLPRAFASLIRNPLSKRDDPEPDVASNLHGQWVDVRGGELPVPVSVRVDRAEDGRFMVTGMLIGLNSREELTWQTLRDIKPATVLSYIFSGFDPQAPSRQIEQNRQRHMVDVDCESMEYDGLNWFGSGAPDPLTDDEVREQLRMNAALLLWNGTDRHPPLTKPSRSRASARTDLDEVTRIWLKHKASTPWRATKETAAEMSVSRATVLRRIKEAERLGLIPEGSVAASKARARGVQP